ncbi:MAG: WD40 repeat domain-containing protein [Deltaproteobacteria bacterium]|nr:WD40 repeat domain-containing protein [Deltaproteobacteria bacterium]
MRPRSLFSPLLVRPAKYESDRDRKIREILSQADLLIAEQKYASAYSILRKGEQDYSEIATQKEFLDLIYLCGIKGKPVRLRNYYLRDRLVAHNWVISSFDFSRVRLFASGSWDRTVKLWTIGEDYTVRCDKVLEGHWSGVNVVLFSHDGRYLLSGSDDCTIILWDVNKGTLLHVYRGHTQGISCLALSPNGRLFASGSWDATVRVWDIESGNCVKVLSGMHTMKVSSVSFVNEFTVFSTDSIRVTWDLRTGKILHIYRGSPSFNFYTHIIKIGGMTIKPPHKKSITAWALAVSQRFLVSGSGDGTICLFELDWEWEFPEPADWDEGARPYLEIFLKLHTPYGPDGFSLAGPPQWTEEDFQKLLYELGLRGFGWLRPEGVRRELEKMAAQKMKP